MQSESVTDVVSLSSLYLASQEITVERYVLQASRCTHREWYRGQCKTSRHMYMWHTQTREIRAGTLLEYVQYQPQKCGFAESEP